MANRVVVITHGPSEAMSMHHDKESNIFPAGPPDKTQSIRILSMIPLVEKILTFCFSLNKIHEKLLCPD